MFVLHLLLAQCPGPTITHNAKFVLIVWPRTIVIMYITKSTLGNFNLLSSPTFQRAEFFSNNY